MEARTRTWFDDRGLIVAASDGGPERRLPFWAGAMHYWRLEPRVWPRCLRELRGLGLNLVETYVPWSVHETAGGRHDWTGARDLGRFIDLAAEAGLDVVLRPGPHCNAELTGFGYPDRVLRDPQLLARGAHGGPVWMPSPPRAFPVPSYASAAFRGQVEAWYAAVAEVVVPRLAPGGPVVALGVDNEAQMFFRLGAYDHDYHPDAIAWWHEADGDGEPPRRWDPDDAERCVRWVRFKDEYTARALGELSAALDRVGFAGIARLHNLPPGEPQWADLPRVARAVGGPAGIDLYAPRTELVAVKRRALHLVGSAEPLPLVPELGIGFSPWLPPIDPDDQREVMLTALACGVRGFNLYMAVGRDRWYGGAIDDEGAPGPAEAWLMPLLTGLRELDWPSLRRHASVAVVVSRADARFGLASSWIDPVTPVIAEALGLGPGGSAELGRDDAAIAQRRWLTAVQQALELAQIPYVLVDEACPAARLAGFRAVIAPTFDRIDAGLLSNLRLIAEQRGVVVLGPGTPTLDELGRPLADPTLPRRAGMMRAASIDDLEGLADDLAAAAPPPTTWTIGRGQGVDCMAFADAAGQVRAVFVINRSAKPARAEVQTPGPLTARDVLTGATLHATDDDTLLVSMAAHAVRFLAV